MPILANGTSGVFLAMWFVASVALVAVVTLVYVFVLNKSPPPDTLTVAKIDSSREVALSSGPDAILAEARTSLEGGNLTTSVEQSVRAVELVLRGVLGSSGNVPEAMSISDLAYLIQTRAKTPTDISQPAYQLNLLRLKILQGQSPTSEEADWAFRTASWLMELSRSNQIAV